MVNFFRYFKIKHVDLPYILILLGIFTAILVISLLTVKITTVILIAICTLPILILLLNYHFYRANEIITIQQQQKYQAYFSLFNLIKFRLPIPYMTSWAATPELALVIYQIIKHERPQQIVELGSGISSLISAYGLEENGQGTLFSLDHDNVYGKKTKDMLKRHQLDNFVSIAYAPLKEQVINDETCIWYDCSDAKVPDGIDLLIVDGPPFKTQEKARYPAFHYFLPKLSASATIIIHDAFREAEASIIDDWLKEHTDFTKETIDSEKGIVILRR